jgi:hypothetical protein
MSRQQEIWGVADGKRAKDDLQLTPSSAPSGEAPGIRLSATESIAYDGV